MEGKYYKGVTEQDIFHRWIEAATVSHREFVFTTNEELYWTVLGKPLSECSVALVSTSGVHRKDQEPFNTFAHEGDSTYREIPSDTPQEELMVTHSHYNHRDADRDINCLFPVDRIKELAAEGFIGEVAPMHYGLMGFVPNGQIVVETTGPQLAHLLHEQGVDIVLFSPG
jgi:D-proline reductase (dithiol) PrdB